MLDAEGRIRDLSGHVDDLAGPTVSLEALARLRALDPAALPRVDDGARLGPCLAHVPAFYAIGLNYAAHARETGAAPPDAPVLFNKAPSALSGPFDPLPIPPGADRVDWEVELGVVIGARTYRVDPGEALAHVAGYCTLNDISERRYQYERGGQHVKGKSAPGFGPIGPWLVSAEQVPDPQALRLTCRVNGETRQDGITADMIVPVAELIAHVSEFLALVPGDILATGTPPGVGLGMDPPQFLREGDVVEAEVEGLGAQRQEVVVLR